MKGPEIKVLMIDDDEEDFIITRDIVSGIEHHKYSVQWAGDYDRGLEEVMKQDHNVYLVDYNLGVRSGVELIREARSRNHTAPFILLTGQHDFQVDHSALEAGASDFLVKGRIDARQLESSIRYSMEHARIQEEQKLLNLNLEERIRERTAVLEEAVQELNKTRKELSDALVKEKGLNELKSRFISTTSHEFRTPLAMVLSSLTLVQKYGDLNDKDNQLRHITRIKSAVNHLTDLLDDVLLVGKLEEGKVAVRYEEFDLTQLISETLTSFRLLLKGNQLLDVKHKGRPVVMSDEKILEQVLINLLSNAIKFSPDGGKITLSSETGKTGIRISVSDEGIGISEEDKENLFGRFFRGKNAAGIQGTGLGLNIVVKQMELLKGKISCESELGKGSTFTITIPIP
ncbi:MAG: hybrid sensor histidine kinase/response regulator [Bacteroidia bacterium]|nr:hybrid sensor histidine kinase/response regulator [Bacteroidia bacterium]